MRKLLGILLLATAACAAEPPRPAVLRTVSVGAVQIEPALLMSLAGADVDLLRERLEGEVRLAGVRLGDDRRLAGRGYLEVRVDGGRTKTNSVAYRVNVTLRRQPAAPPASKRLPEMETVAQRTIEGEASPSALSIQVLVAMEEQAAVLLREHATTRGA